VALYPPELQDRPTAIWVVGHGWHTGIVVRRSDISSALWPEHNDFTDSRYLEVGWGDREFYQAPDGGSRLALRAALVPGQSVLHVVGFDPPVGAYFAGSEVVEVRLSRRGFDELTRFIHTSYARDADGRAVKLGRGLYGRSQFYLATGTYHLLNTCNNWVARALRAAGCPITPAWAMTAGNVMDQVRQFGRAVR
jgi:uncharacterized protein (TIGR02117 family)